MLWLSDSVAFCQGLRNVVLGHDAFSKWKSQVDSGLGRLGPVDKGSSLKREMLYDRLLSFDNFLNNSWEL